MFRSRGKQGLHHLSLGDLRSANEQNCRICTPLYRYQEAKNADKDIARITEFRYQFYVHYDGHSDRVNVQIRHKRENPFWFTVELINQGKSCATGMIGAPLKIENELPNCTSDERVISLARDWLQTCQSHHKECQRGNDSWFPKRLLYLKGGTIRLLIREKEMPTDPYVALSHCWGDNPNFITLTACNLDSYTKKINLVSLSKTFRDAIDITRRLGFHYLWIDSLCILQSGEGSREDWLEHASQMASVYLNCALNIAADNAKGPNDGCYTRRIPKAVEKIQIPWHNFTEETSLWQLYAWETCGQEYLKSSRLSSRAWVVQERLLSQRVLHMCSDQIIWECNAIPLACECRPMGIPNYLSTYHGLRAFDFAFILLPFARQDRQKRVSDDHTISAGERNDHWNAALQEYTACNLTKPDKDKLVALSGLARIISDMFGDEYVVGFFRSRILWDLPWEISRGDFKKGRSCRATGNYRAPSWSWASINGPVFFGSYPSTQQLFAQVHKIDVEMLDPSNPWGAVRSGVLVLRCLLLPLQLSSTVKQSDSYIFEAETAFWKEELRVVSSILVYPDEPLEGILKGGNLFAVPLSANRDPINISVTGLVLSNRSNAPGYRRVGTFRDDYSCKTRHLWEAAHLQRLEKDHCLIEIY
jgi:hypothetical protein